jgi:hypothetical protein
MLMQNHSNQKVYNVLFIREVLMTPIGDKKGGLLKND